MAKIASAMLGPRVDLFRPAPFSRSFEALVDPVCFKDEIYLPGVTIPLIYDLYDNLTSLSEDFCTAYQVQDTGCINGVFGLMAKNRDQVP